MADFDSADSGSSPGRAVLYSAVLYQFWKSWRIGTPPVSKTGKPLAMQVRILSLPREELKIENPELEIGFPHSQFSNL